MDGLKRNDGLERFQKLSIEEQGKYDAGEKDDSVEDTGSILASLIWRGLILNGSDTRIIREGRLLLTTVDGRTEQRKDTGQERYTETIAEKFQDIDFCVLGICGNSRLGQTCVEQLYEKLSENVVEGTPRQPPKAALLSVMLQSIYLACKQKLIEELGKPVKCSIMIAMYDYNATGIEPKLMMLVDGEIENCAPGKPYLCLGTGSAQAYQYIDDTYEGIEDLKGGIDVIEGAVNTGELVAQDIFEDQEGEIEEDVGVGGHVRVCIMRPRRRELQEQLPLSTRQKQQDRSVTYCDVGVIAP